MVGAHWQRRVSGAEGGEVERPDHSRHVGVGQTLDFILSAVRSV